MSFLWQDFVLCMSYSNLNSKDKCFVTVFIIPSNDIVIVSVKIIK